MTVVEKAVPDVLKQAAVDADTIVGLGVDFTSCTVLPVTSDGVPLCTIDQWRERRHAWPKLWKHHSAQPIADRLNEVALERGDAFLERYGGRISSEWYFPKLIEVWLEDREIYDECAGFIEATDWIVWWITGVECRQTATAGLQGDVVAGRRTPPDRVLRGRLSRASTAPARSSVTRSRRWARRRARSGPRWRNAPDCSESVAVAVGNVDAWVSVPGVGVEEPGTFVIVIGTSICDMIVHPEETRLPGITGVVKDGILPGLYGYEAGQAAVGDMLAWFVDDVVMDSDSYGKLERGGGEARSGRDRAGRARLVERQPLDPRRRRPHGRDLRTDAAHHARADLPRAARVDRVRQPPDHGQLRGARPRADSRSWPAAGSPSAAR